MRAPAFTRPVLTAAVACGLVLGSTGADAATPVLDGKKTKTITFKAVGAPQANDATATANDLSGVGRLGCQAPECATLDFVYKPAKGVKATGLAFESTWTTPVGADIDLFVAAVDKYGDLSEIGRCGATVGTREKIYLAASNFKTGKKYRMIAYFYRTVNEPVTTKVTFNGANTIPSTVPKDADGVVFPVNCAL